MTKKLIKDVTVGLREALSVFTLKNFVYSLTTITWIFTLAVHGTVIVLLWVAFWAYVGRALWFAIQPILLPL